MELEEIEKLRIRVEKDPNSRLFLPLAEEYRKAGMLDEAIAALLNGLKRQPGYTSARVALGKIYLEKNMLNEARAEFENVVSVIPDNLFAHRKLADIYKEIGDAQKALSEYRLVVRLNPLDEEARMYLESLGGMTVKESEAAPPAPVTEAVKEFRRLPVEEAVSDLTIEEEAVEEPVVETQQPLGSDFDEFKSFFAEYGVGGVSKPAATDITEKAQEIEDFGKTLEGETYEEKTHEPSGELAFDEFFERMVSREGGERVEVDLSAADSFVAGGNYSKAIEAYNEMLDNDPENKLILQRIAELKSFLKLIGKGDDLLIARLEALLDAIKQRGLKKADELHGGT